MARNIKSQAPRGQYRVVWHHTQAFLYSTSSDSIYPISRRAAEIVNQADFDFEKLDELERSCSPVGYKSPPKRPEHDAIHDQIRTALESQVNQIVLGITENCNLKCEYCVYSGSYQGLRIQSTKRMKWGIAKKGIDYLLQHCEQSPVPPGIAFYGGEPLLEFPLISQCVQYTKAVFGSKARFVITTNGTLLRPDVREFLVENDFGLIVSLDGPAEIHDRYRHNANGRPTFDLIMSNLMALKEDVPEYFDHRVRLSVVLAPPVDYALLKAFFDKTRVPSMISPMEMHGINDDCIQPPANANFEFLANCFEEVCKESMRDEGPNVVRRFEVALLGPGLRRIQTRGARSEGGYYWLGQCIPGVRKTFIDPFGNMYPCEKVEGGSDVRIGHIDIGVDVKAVEGLMDRFMGIVDRHCDSCWMRRMCSACLVDVVHGGSFDVNKLHARCTSRWKTQADLLGLYAGLLHKDAKLLEFLHEAYPWE